MFKGEGIGARIEAWWLLYLLLQLAEDRPFTE